MKKIIAFLLFIFLSFPSVLLAQESALLDSQPPFDQEVYEGLYVDVAETINLTGTYNGDVWIAGGTVTIDAIVNGDLHVAGGDISFSGLVNGDLILAGGNVTVTGIIVDDLAIFAGQATIQKESATGGSLLIASGDTTLYGQTEGQAKIFTGDTTMSAIFMDDLDLFAGSSTLLSGTLIEGDLNYTVPQEGVNFQDPIIVGQTTYHQPPEYSNSYDWDVPAKTPKSQLYTLFSKSIFGLLSGLVLGYLVFTLFGQKLTPILDQIEKKPALNLVKGLIILVLSPFVLFLLLITVLGIPVSLLTGASLLIAITLSKTFIAFSLGRFILKKPKTLVFNHLFVGLLALQALLLVPFVSTLTKIAIVTVGLGAQFSYFKTLTKKKK